jgi:hypothetical protein
MLQWFKRKAVAARIYGRYGALKLRRSLRQRSNRRRLDRRGGVVTFHLHSEVGLFAHLSWCLQIAAYCRQREITPRFVATSPQYGDHGEDWFGLLFDQPPAAQNASRSALISVREFEELPFYTERLLTDLSSAAQLQRDCFPVAAQLVKQADQFALRHFRSGATLGCHFRGTDKGIEANRVAYTVLTRCLRERLSALAGPPVLFIATDETAFIDHARREFPSLEVISADVQRSTTGQALHFDPALRGRKRAEEALIDSLLLARCDHLVKSPSALSAWSALFNPRLPVTLVGRPFAHAMFFPENVLLEAGAALVDAA